MSTNTVNTFLLDLQQTCLLYILPNFFQIGMCSACINPVLYGFLNETFKREFIEISRQPFCCSNQSQSHPTPEVSPLTNGRGLKTAVELKVVVEEDTKHLMKVESRLIPRRDSPPCGFKSSSKTSKMSPELVTVHNTCAS